MLGTALCATAQLTGRVATSYMHPVKMCAFRYGFAIPIAWVVSGLDTGRWIPELTTHQILMTAFIAIMAWGFGAILFFTAMKKDSVHRVAPVSNSLSIWAVLIALIFLGESFFPALAVVLLLLIVGIACMTPAATKESRWRWALPAALGVSILWAVSVVLTKVTISGIAPSTFVFCKMIAAAAFHVACYPFIKEPLDVKGIKFVAISSITLVLGDTLLVVGINALPASVFSPVFAATIPFTFIGSVLFLGEKPLKRNWIGMAMIFLAAALCGYYGSR